MPGVSAGHLCQARSSSLARVQRLRVRKALANLGSALLVLLFVPLYVIIVALFFACIPILASWYVVKIVTLKSRWRRVHGRHGKFILFVYSNSPNWKDYIEANILPHIKDHCVILNWSDRSSWEKNRPWEVDAFKHWGGHREFNPIAIIIPPSGRVQTIRFWQAFRAYKHGKDLKLRKAEAQLLDVFDTYAQHAG